MASTHAGVNRTGDVPRDETDSLISSDKVEGTAVYGADGQKIGRIETLMIGKRTGQVAYAVLSFGGFLGIGSDHYPLPWPMLKYGESKGGYVVNITREQLKSAPRYPQDEGWDWSSREYVEEVDRYYIPFAII